MTIAWIYIIHFDEPLHHARHYVGCTEALKERLITHAQGHGSNILAVLKAKGISWRLASLYRTCHAGMRRVERAIKDCSAGPRFCSVCSNLTPKIRGCTYYDISNLRFPTNSASLQKMSRYVKDTVRFSTPADIIHLPAIIRGLQRADKDALGFIPAGGRADQGLDRLIPLGRIALAIEGKEIVGLCAYTLNQSGTRLTIHQCVVLDGSRFKGHGRRMLDLISSIYEDIEFSCHVRADLAANMFWLKCGFVLTSTKTHRTSGSVLNHYVRSPISEL